LRYGETKKVKWALFGVAVDGVYEEGAVPVDVEPPFHILKLAANGEQELIL